MVTAVRKEEKPGLIDLLQFTGLTSLKERVTFTDRAWEEQKRACDLVLMTMDLVDGLKPGSERIKATLTARIEKISQAARRKADAFPDQLQIAGELQRRPMNLIEFFSNLPVTVGPHPKQLEITADPEKLKTVFTDLIGSAKEAGSNRTHISCLQYKDSAYIHVLNHGRGISKDRIDKIFEKGSDLYAVNNIVTVHGGRMRVFWNETRPQKTGTDFEIILPTH